MARQLFTIKLYKNIPMNNMNNVVWFDTKTDMDAWFDQDAFGVITLSDVNIAPATRSVRWPARLDLLYDYNYMRIIGPKGYDRYAYIETKTYINDNVTQIDFIVDIVQSLAYGQTVQNILGNTQVLNEHAQDVNGYQTYINMLNHNSDILGVNNARAVKQWVEDFGAGGWYVIYTVSADLTKNPGTDDAPLLNVSKGQTYDNLISPQDLYIDELSVYEELMNELSDYPWIARNITKNAQVPALFVDTDDIEAVSTSKYGKIHKFKNGAHSANFTAHFTLSLADIRSAAGISATGEEDYLLRNPYTFFTLSNNQGQEVQLFIEDLDFSSRDISLGVKTMFGYDNTLVMYPERYNNYDENTETNFVRGEGLGHALHWTDFNSIPTLIDSGIAYRADTAYNRQNTENRTFQGSIKNALDPSVGTADRLASAVQATGSIVGIGQSAQSAYAGQTAGLNSENTTQQMGRQMIMKGTALGAVAGIANIATNLKDDQYTYQNIQANLNQAKTNSPSILNSNPANTFAMANGIFGWQLHMWQVPDKSRDLISLYHKQFGYSWNMYKVPYQFNMTVMNYLKVDADHTAASSLIYPYERELLLTRLRAGQKFWKANGYAGNVFNQNLNNNVIITS